MEASQIRVLIVGSGVTGRAHADAFAAHVEKGRVAIYAPSAKNREAVETAGHRFLSGEIESAVREIAPTHAVVVAPVDRLAGAILALVAQGVKHLLVEKPGAITRAEAENVRQAAAKTGARIQVAYNRRFFASVRMARKMIEASGEKIESVHCEFTEWAHTIEPLTNHSPATKARWLLANSLHPIDLAFFAVGLPRAGESSFWRRGEGALGWHPSGSSFYGAGVTEKGALFDRHAHWSAPGRWRVEWLTPSTRYLFCPMEKLQITKKGSVALTEVELPDADLDVKFKPGFYHQARAFLDGTAGALCEWEQAIDLIALGERIGGYA